MRSTETILLSTKVTRVKKRKNKTWSSILLMMFVFFPLHLSCFICLVIFTVQMSWRISILDRSPEFKSFLSCLCCFFPSVSSWHQLTEQHQTQIFIIFIFVMNLNEKLHLLRASSFFLVLHEEVSLCLKFKDNEKFTELYWIRQV